MRSWRAQAAGLGGRHGAVPGRGVHRRERMAHVADGRAGLAALGHLQHVHRSRPCLAGLLVAHGRSALPGASAGLVRLLKVMAAVCLPKQDLG